jgi:hypothetical protein
VVGIDVGLVGATYVNWPATTTADVPLGVVTLTSTGPVLPTSATAQVRAATGVRTMVVP